MLRLMWRGLETELWQELRHRRHRESGRQQLLLLPAATAPVLDPTGVANNACGVFGLAVVEPARPEKTVQLETFL